MYLAINHRDWRRFIVTVGPQGDTDSKRVDIHLPPVPDLI
jgi:hypothetical protein